MAHIREIPLRFAARYGGNVGAFVRSKSTPPNFTLIISKLKCVPQRQSHGWEFLIFLISNFKRVTVMVALFFTIL